MNEDTPDEPTDESPAPAHAAESQLITLLGEQLRSQGRLLTVALVLIALLSGANLAINVFGLIHGASGEAAEEAADESAAPEELDEPG